VLLMQSLYCWRHASSPFCSGHFEDGKGRGLVNYLPGLASNCDPSELSLLSSYNERHELKPSDSA
jgi:hypothetical protein